LKRWRDEKEKEDGDASKSHPDHRGDRALSRAINRDRNVMKVRHDLNSAANSKK